MSKRLIKKTTITDDKMPVSEKNAYVRKLIEQLRKSIRATLMKHILILLRYPLNNL